MSALAVAAPQAEAAVSMQPSDGEFVTALLLLQAQRSEQQQRRRRKRLVWGFGVLVVVMIMLGVAWPRWSGSSAGGSGWQQQEQGKHWSKAVAAFQRRLRQTDTPNAAEWLQAALGKGGSSSSGSSSSSFVVTAQDVEAATASWSAALQHALGDADLALLLNSVEPAPGSVKLPHGDEAAMLATKRAAAAAEAAAHWLPCKLLLLQRATSHLAATLEVPLGLPNPPSRGAGGAACRGGGGARAAGRAHGVAGPFGQH